MMILIIASSYPLNGLSTLFKGTDAREFIGKQYSGSTDSWAKAVSNIDLYSPRYSTTKIANFITINVPLFLEVRDFMFFMRGKHIISHFAGFFEGAKTKKVEAPSKNPKKWLIMCFSQLKNIKFQTFKISGT
jgi:hypothetical protein